MAEENNPILTLEIRLLNKEQLPDDLIKIAEEHFEGKRNVTTKCYLVKCSNEDNPNNIRKATINITSYTTQLSKLKRILEDKKEPRICGVPLTIPVYYDGQKHHIKIKNSKLYLE